MSRSRRPTSVWALLVASFSMACHGETQQELVLRNIGKELDPRQIVVTMERTACLGFCPTYRVTLTAAGDLEYEGTTYVKVTGIRQSTLPQEDALKIVNELLRVRIFDAPPEYHGQAIINSDDGKLTFGALTVSDLPWIYLELRIGDHVRRVGLYSNIPKELEAIPDLIDRVTRSEQWVGTLCERVPAGRPECK